MIEPIDVLIVEDESSIADVHSFYLKKTGRFRPVGVAQSINEARNMVRILKPKLIFLDNYLPDGRGIEFLKELTHQSQAADVIFITAACDMETVREAVRCGVFDYLLKPIAYDRVQNSLERYLKYIGSLRANDSVNQRHVDELFNFQSKTELLNNLPKGIDELTLIKIQEIYRNKPQAAYTAELLGQAIGISKTTARRYLEYCVASGFLEAFIQHGRVGRPERLYQKR